MKISERLRSRAETCCWDCCEQCIDDVEAADRIDELEAWCEKLQDQIEKLASENEPLRLDVEIQEALHVSAYHAGLKAGWNFCVDDNHAGFQKAMASTEHIKELRRIRDARAALGGKA